MRSSLKSFALVAIFGITQVHSHGLPTEVVGFNGVNQLAVGATNDVPRNGARPNPFEGDTSIIRDNEIASGKAGPCGRNKINGNTDIAKAMSAAMAADGGTLPSASSDGTVMMTLHQVNQDGAGPYSCDVSTDASGQNFKAMTMKSNVPGIISLSTATASNFTLAAQMPAGATCTGGPNGNACLVRCRNQAAAGPFGGCALVQNSDGADGTPTPSAGTDAKAGKAGGAGGGLGDLLGGLGGGAAGGKGGAGGLLSGLGLRAAANDNLVQKLNAVETAAKASGNTDAATLANQASAAAAAGDKTQAITLLQGIPHALTNEDEATETAVNDAITAAITKRSMEPMRMLLSRVTGSLSGHWA